MAKWLIPLVLGVWIHLVIAWLRIADQPALNYSCTAFGVGCPPKPEVHGFSGITSKNSKGELINEIFQRQLRDGLTEGASVAVWIGDELVMSLSGGRAHSGNLSDSTTRFYDKDTLQVIFSSGKSLEAVAMAILVEQGHIKYDDPISKVWPEFAEGGKASVTLTELLRHEGGMAFFTDQEPVTPEDILNRIEEVDRRLAKNAHTNPGERGRIYHALMRGIVLDAIVRRVDPKKRDFSTFFKEEISIPLNIQDTLHVKLDEALASSSIISPFIPEQLPRVITHFALNNVVQKVLYPLANLLRPHISPESSSKIDEKLHNIVRPLASSFADMLKDISDPTSTLWKSAHKGIQTNEFLQPKETMWANQAIYRRVGLSSGGIYSNAESVAKVLSIAANGGRFGDKTFWSSSVNQKFLHATEDSRLYDPGLSTYSTFTDGGVAKLTPSILEEMCEKGQQKPCYGITKEGHTIYGWAGAGGSLAVFIPSLNLSFAYVMNSCNGFELMNPRAGEFLQLTLDHLTANKQQVSRPFLQF